MKSEFLMHFPRSVTSGSSYYDVYADYKESKDKYSIKPITMGIMGFLILIVSFF